MRTKFHNWLISASVYSLIFVLIFSLGAIALKLSALKSPGALPKDSPGTARQARVVVKPGDTLWGIARTQMPNDDPRDAVGDILKLNNLDSARIFPGQVLLLPAQHKSAPLQLVNQSGN